MTVLQLKKEFTGLAIAYELPANHDLRSQMEERRATVEKYLDELLVFTSFTFQRLRLKNVTDENMVAWADSLTEEAPWIFHFYSTQKNVLNVNLTFCECGVLRTPLQPGEEHPSSSRPSGRSGA